MSTVSPNHPGLAETLPFNGGRPQNPALLAKLEQVMSRAEATLDRAQQLVDLLMTDGPFEVEPLDFEVPANFKLSIVIPVFNEEKTIYEILARVAAVPLPKEIIVVDDCSTDQTAELLGALTNVAELKVVTKGQNAGKGAALRTGFEQATGDVVLVQDADLEYDPRDIPALVKPIIQNNADAVFGSRFLWNRPQDQSFVHRLGNWALTTASNLFTGLKVTDMEVCYKAFRRELIQSLDLQQDRFGFEPEVTAKIARKKARVTEVPVRYNPRSYAEGKKIGVRDLWNALWCIVRYGIAR